jgi:hypothetical protein
MVEVYIIDNISKQTITIYVQMEDDSQVFHNDNTQVPIQPHHNITVEEYRVNLGQLVHLSKLKQLKFVRSYVTTGSGSTGSGSTGSGSAGSSGS